MDYDSPQTAEIADTSLPTNQVQGSTADQSTTAGLELVNGREAVAGEVLVAFRPGRAGKIPGIRNKMKAKELKVIPRVGVHCWRIESKKSVSQAIKELASNPDVKYAEANYLVYAAATPNDPFQSKLWGLHNTGKTGGTPDADIDAPEAWNIATGSNQIVVGVIDTGVDYMHPDLAANMWTNEAERNGIAGVDDDGNGYVDDIYGWDFCNNDNDPYDDNGHGTHCSGTIGAVGNNGAGLAGVNWNVKIMALKFLNAQNTGSTADAVEAISYATMMRQQGVNIVLTSNSWGGTALSQILMDAISASRQAGMLFVAAAGNNNINTDSTPNYPSCFNLDNIISVAATDYNDKRASFSNWGATSVDLGAPGVDIWSTIPENAYAVYSGTSMATPHVSGVAALVWGLAPGCSYIQIRNAILSGVDPISMDKPVVTGGRLNAFGAIKNLRMTVTESTPAEGEIIVNPEAPTSFVVRFSFPVNESTLQAADLIVNNQAASSVVLSEDNLAAAFQFDSSPCTSEGEQVLSIPFGAIETLSSVPSIPQIEAWTAMFRWDQKQMEVIGTNPSDGSAVTLPFTSLMITFNEPYAAASLDPGDLILSEGTATAVAGGGENSVIFTVDGILPQESTFTVNIPAGAVTDIYGNPMLPYSGSFKRDFGVVVFPTKLQSSDLLGSLIYQGTVSGTIGQGDTDSFMMNIDSGQTITVIVDPDADLRPSVTLSGKGINKTISAGNPGQNIAIQVEPTTNITSMCTISVSGVNTSGAYTIEVLLNAAVEQESLGGPENDDILLAQNLDAGIVSPYAAGIGRGAVCGKVNWQSVPPQVLEGFESGNLNAYVAGPGKKNSNTSVITAAKHDGSFGLQDKDNTGQSGWIYRNDGQVHVKQGDLISVWVRSEGQPTGRAFFGFGASSSGTLSVVMAPDTGQLLLQRNVTYGYQDIGSVSYLGWQPDHWYRLEISWGISGDISACLYDSDGVTPLATVTANDTTITSGGIAFRAFGSTKHFDTVEIFPPVNTDPDCYAFTLKAGEKTTLVLKTSTDQFAMEIRNFTNAILATGTVSAANADSVIRDFVAPVTGTYIVRITGENQMEYKLLILRGGTFDLEYNNDLVSAQDITSQNAVLGHIGVSSAVLGPIISSTVVGYYTDPGGFGPDGLISSSTNAPETAIIQAGFIPIHIQDITNFDFTAIDILMVNESYNRNLSSNLLSRLGAIEAWVRNGGIFIVHDRFVSNDRYDPQSNPFLVGASNIRVDRDILTYGNDIDIMTPGTLVTEGPHGLIDNDMLDNGKSSNHGFALGESLPAESVSILSAGPAANNRVAAFSYGLDKGFIYYATIPLDYFLEIDGVNNFKTIYAPNVLLYMKNLKRDADWYRLTVNPGDNIFLETHTPANGVGEFVNDLNPMIRLYDSSGVFLESVDDNTPDDHNASLLVGAGNYYIQITSSDIGESTRGEYILSLKLPAITVAPVSSLVTSEDGQTVAFTVVLNTPPTSTVTIPLSSSDPSEGSVSSESLTFSTTNWNVAQTVIVTGVNDNEVDEDVPYTIHVGPAVSNDQAYAGLNASDVSITNLDNDTPSGPAIVGVSSISYTIGGGKIKPLLVTIQLKDDFGNPVQGASVSATLMLNGMAVTSWTAATGVDGKTTYTYNNGLPGTYTTVITDINASGLTWDGVTPINSFKKK